MATDVIGNSQRAHRQTAIHTGHGINTRSYLDPYFDLDRYFR